MDKIRLGRTDLMVSRSGFGALPIQRVSFDEARLLLRKAYNNGINFFDTARAYSDSEEKMGYSLADVRKDIIIATKSPAKDKNSLLHDIETSLKMLKTDYVDILQLHNPKKLPDPDDPNGLYAGLMEAKRMGMTRYIGVTNHSADIAIEAAATNLYDTIQYPLNTLSSAKELKVIEECRKMDLGVIAMKGLSGGLITNAASTFAFLRQYNNVVPIWGIQREWELDKFLSLEKEPPVLDESMMKIIEKDREELAGDFCRSCGYCMPCPVGIEIPNAARISLLLGRAPYQQFIGEEWQQKMALVNKCIECGQCRSRCPYELDTPNLLKRELKRYNEFCASIK